MIEKCLEGVWRVSGWCLIYPGYCQDSIDGKPIDKNRFVILYSTTALRTDALHSANIDRFDCVWKVSGRSLGVVRVTWNTTAWRVIMPNQLMKLK